MQVAVVRQRERLDSRYILEVKPPKYIGPLRFYLNEGLSPDFLVDVKYKHFPFKPLFTWYSLTCS